MTDALAILMRACRAAGLPVSADDVADAAWLARWLTPAVEAAPAPLLPDVPPEPRDSADQPRPPVTPRREPRPPAKTSSRAPSAAPGPSAALHLPSAGGAVGGVAGKAFRAPLAPALPRPLEIARALRPLARRVPSRTRFVLDEAETVRRAAEEAICVPAVRPARERWLRLALVIDTGGGSHLWQQTAREFQALLGCLGAFRDVRAWSLDTDARPPRLLPGAWSAGPATPRHPRELTDPSGRTLVVVMSPCVSAGWDDGTVASVLNLWSARGPVLLVPLLPEHLWSRTALAAGFPVRLTAPAAGVSNRQLLRSIVDAWPGEDVPPGVGVPVAVLEPASLRAWAGLVAGKPGAVAPGFVFDPNTAVPPDATPEDSLSADDRVDRFRKTASPVARKLAGLVAAAPVVSLPVLRLIRQAALPEAGQTHEAEVLLGGLLVRAGSDGRDGERFEFHPGVREKLLDSTPADLGVRVLEAVSNYVGERLASGRTFAALLADPTGAAGELVPDESPFARVAAEVLRRAGGEYAQLVRWDAEPTAEEEVSSPDPEEGAAPGGQPAAGPEPYIFVCCARSDANEVLPTIVALDRLGCRVGREKSGEAGSHWFAERVRLIDGCALFLVFLSPGGVASEYVRQEVDVAFERKKRILAVHLAPVELPPDLQYLFAGVQTIRKYEVAADQFPQLLARHLPPEVLAKPPAPPPAPPEPSSFQERLRRVRPPRVQITYDVELAGAMEQKELPFVVGVLADLSATPAEPLPPLRDRQFVEIDRDNIDYILEQSVPRLALRVPNRLTDDSGSQLNVELRFRSLADFEPARVAEQVPVLNELLRGRRELLALSDRIAKNESLEQSLAAIITDPEKLRSVHDAVERGWEESASADPPGDGFDPLAWRETVFEQLWITDEYRPLGANLVNSFVWAALSAGWEGGNDVERVLQAGWVRIDRKLSAQVSEILHHPAFQKLEATWRGLRYLVYQTETGPGLKLRVLNATRAELERDLDRAVEFDRSAVFQKVYAAEYGVLGGTPYGLLVGDYEFEVGRPADVSLLQKIAGVAAAAHAVFVAAAGPRSFDRDRFTDLNHPRDLGRIFADPRFAAWNAFRDSDDSRSVALTCPRVMARLPYGANSRPVDEFNYEESVDGTDHDKYLWVSAAWCYAARVTDAFARYGWFAQTRGVENGGKVEGLPVHTFPTDDGGVALKCPTEVAITDRRENELSSLGFLPLLHVKNTDYAAFFGTQSCHRPRRHTDAAAGVAEEVAGMLNVRLCVSRFAQALKVMARDRVGSFAEASDLQRLLSEWLAGYVAESTLAGEHEQARRPLHEGVVEVRQLPGRPGALQAVLRLRPHFQFDVAGPSLRLVVELPASR